MKRKNLLCAVFLVSGLVLTAQEAVVPSGASSAGSGSVSWTLGQVAPAFGASGTGEVTWGVQHARERIAVGQVELPGNWAQLRVFPNPAAQSVQLDGWAAAGLTAFWIRAVDASGKEVWRRRVKEEASVSVDLADWPSGTYLFEFQAPGIKRAVVELIKTNR
jgi:hypothetical protein